MMPTARIMMTMLFVLFAAANPGQDLQGASAEEARLHEQLGKRIWQVFAVDEAGSTITLSNLQQAAIRTGTIT